MKYPPDSPEDEWLEEQRHRDLHRRRLGYGDPDEYPDDDRDYEERSERKSWRRL